MLVLSVLGSRSSVLAALEVAGQLLDNCFPLRRVVDNCLELKDTIVQPREQILFK